MTDAGGTSYDVSLVRRGRIPRTRETWLGERFTGHMTGFPSVDVRSIGAGGGSIAWVDDGGLLHVGPDSAGADPGPACYHRGGDRATVTDAALVLGYLEPARFLGGAMSVDADAAREAIERCVAVPLGLDLVAAAHAVMEVMTEQMVHAIEHITVNQGIDPREAVLVGGGGAAGLNGVAVGRRLGTRGVLFPFAGAALSAAGALVSDLVAEHAETLPTTTGDFAYDEVNSVLAELSARCDAFLASMRNAYRGTASVEYLVEARYQNQVWELELPLRVSTFRGARDVGQLVTDFHALHREVFEIDDSGSPVELLTWRAHASHRLLSPPERKDGVTATNGSSGGRTQVAYFDASTASTVAMWDRDGMPPGTVVRGPALIDAGLTNIVLPPGAIAHSTATRGVRVDPWVDPAKATE